MKPDLLGVGIDTLELSFYGRPKPIVGELAEGAWDAHADGRSAHYDDQVPCRAGEKWRWSPAGGRGWALLGSLNGDRVLVVRNANNRPAVKVVPGSERLWSEGAQSVLTWVHQVAEALVDVEGQPEIARIDLACDLMGWEPSRDLGDWLTRAVSRRTFDASATPPEWQKASDVHGGQTWQARGEFTGLTFGRGSVLARVYLKSREIAQRGPAGKWFMYDVWQLPRELADDVWRAEFQLRHAALAELGGFTLDGLSGRLPDLWAYCAKQWLAEVSGDATRVERREVTEGWRSVQEAWHSDRRLQRGKIRPLNRATELLLAQAQGVIETARSAAGEAETKETPWEWAARTSAYLQLPPPKNRRKPKDKGKG